MRQFHFFCKQRYLKYTVLSLLLCPLSSSAAENSSRGCSAKKGSLSSISSFSFPTGESDFPHDENSGKRKKDKISKNLVVIMNVFLVVD